MYKFFAIISTCLLLGGCVVYKYLPAENNTTVRDSVAISYRDSINWIPKEKIVDVVPTYDSLKMETSLAKAIAYVDTTTHTLKGSLENKEGVKTKYVSKTKTAQRDSIQIKKIPYPVEKPVKYIPKFFWGTFVFSLIAVLVYIVKIYLKIKTGAIKLPKSR